MPRVGVRMKCVRAVAGLALLTVLLTSDRAAAQAPSLGEVLRRAAAYVGDFTRQLSGIVAEESYVQSVEAATGGRQPAVSRRELRSDFLLVRMTAQERY